VTNTSYSGGIAAFSNLVECSFEEEPWLPKSLRGMSGGPVYNTGGKLVGLIKGESRGGAKGSLYFTPRSRWGDLFHPFESEIEDYMGQKGVASLLVEHHARPEIIRVNVFADFFWSRSNPDRKHGEMGRTIHFTVGHNKEKMRYRVNVESVFNLPIEHTEAERIDVLKLEAVQLMEFMGYYVVK
jgi:hypothetical protein